MGANSQFIHSSEPKDDREALRFANVLIGEALHESGHGGYSGTWAEANGAKQLPDVLPTVEAAELFLLGGEDPADPRPDFSDPNAADRDAWKFAVNNGMCDEGLRTWTMRQREKKTPRPRWIAGRCEKWGPILFVKVATGGYAFGAICSS